jgi:hypothetical protein
MSTSHLSSGLRRHGPPACYRREKDPSHPHSGPFTRCTTCRRVICHECIGKHLASGAVFCVECNRPVYERLVYWLRDLPWHEYRSGAGQVIRFLVSVVAQISGGLWAIFYGLVLTLARPFTSEAEERQIERSILEVLFFYVSGKTLFSFVLVLILASLVITGLGLLYAEVNEIPHPRLLVAIAASATLWALLASQLLYVFKKPLGKLTAQVFAHFVAFIVAILFGAWLVKQTAIDRLLNVFR